MNGPLASLVDWSALGKTVAYALVAGVGLTVAFSFAIVGLVRLDHARSEGSGAAVVGWTAVAILGGLVTLGGVVLGLIVMAHKG
jgi:hypothetical protein